jgi:hypothetical protein
MNLRNGPVSPEPPKANLDNDFQSKTAATQCQDVSDLRSKQALLFRISAVRVTAHLANTDNQIAPTQTDHVLAPQRIGAFQNLTALRTTNTLRPVIPLRNMAIIFSTSHSRLPFWQ